MTTATASPAGLGHLRILASAGSGKTRALATRYLALLHAGAKPETILASTFTRLAAAEIRDRILVRLVEAIEDENEREKLAGEIGAADFSRERALDMLVGVARQIHALNIRTLDSFLAAIVQGFAIELGLTPGSRIVDEEENASLRSEAIRRMLDESDAAQLVETLRRLTRGDAGRSVTWAIRNVVDRLYVLSLETEDDAWDFLPEVDGELRPPALAEAVNRFAQIPDHPAARALLKPMRSDIDRAISRDWETLLERGVAAKIAGGETTYSGKAIPPILVEHYRPIIAHAGTTLMNRARRQALATRDLLRTLRTYYDDLKREKAVVTFLDLSTALDRAERLGTLDEICYRIDRRLEHVLLDEFQDTSIAQWRALEPNLRELVSDETTGRTFFCVGDLKQAIYVWRDATPDILADVPRLLFGEGGEEAIAEEHLPVSWRSAQPIIDAVNCAFESLETNMALAKAPRAAAEWSSYFQHHEIADRNKRLSGYVELRAVERHDETKDREHARIAAATEIVCELHQRAPAIEIGVLTRTTRMADQLLFELQRRGVPAAGAGGGPLTDVAAVNAALDLLALAHSPEHSAAAFHVANSPLGRIVEFEDFAHHGRRRALARRVRREIYEFGFAPFIARLARKLAPHCEARELRRLARLADLGESFDRLASRDLSAFINFVEQREVDDSQPSPVTVLTIHRAKGLEYDAVVLPELDFKLDAPGPAEAIYERDGVAGRITRICPHISGTVRNLLARAGCDIEPLVEAHDFREVRESLCLLYVAMTRAKRGLYMLIDPPREKKGGGVYSDDLATPAGLLWNAMGDASSPPQSCEIVARYGDERWMKDASCEDTTALAARSALAGPIQFRAGRTRPIASRAAIAPSMGDRQAPLATRIHVPDREATERGSALHALFERITWLEEFEARDEELAEVCLRAAPRRSERWITARVGEFRRIVECDVIRQTLSRSQRTGPDVRLWRERPFAQLTDAGLVQGVIDRLEVEFEHARPVRATIIDFKTDAMDADAIEEAAAVHLPQMHAYRDAVADMFGLNHDAIELCLIFTAAGCLWRSSAQRTPDCAPPADFADSLFE